MLKNILNLKGAQQLSKKEQNAINGGDSPYGVCTENGCDNCVGTCFQCQPPWGDVGTELCRKEFT